MNNWIFYGLGLLGYVVISFGFLAVLSITRVGERAEEISADDERQ